MLMERESRQSPFLKQAASGQVTQEKLSQWLAQDRLYAQNYVNFVGGALTKLRLPVTVDRSATEVKYSKLLSFALSNVIREVGFFEDTSEQYGLDLCPVWTEEESGMSGTGPNQTTRSYIDLMSSSASSASSLLESATMLWGMEVCYYTAWSYAKQHLVQQDLQDLVSSNAAFAALHKEFIPNWTCDEFVQFVGDCKAVMDELAAKASEEDKARATEVFRQVLWLEEKFWPTV